MRAIVQEAAQCGSHRRRHAEARPVREEQTNARACVFHRQRLSSLDPLKRDVHTGNAPARDARA